MNQEAKRSNFWIKAFCTIGDNITNARVPFKHRIQGVVKKFNDYIFYSFNNKMRVLSRPFNFSKIKLSKYLKNTNMSNYKNKGLPLPINNVSKIVGVFKGGVPFRVDSHDYFDDFYVHEVISNEFEYRNHIPHNKQIIPGSWCYSNQNLIDMATPKHNYYNSRDLINGIFSRVGIDFHLPYIKYWSIEMLNGILTKGSAFPGLLTSKLLYKTRRQTTGLMKEFCKEYFLYIIKRYKQVFDLSLMTIGGREKRVTYTEGFKILKTRIIIMMEDIPTLLGQSVAVPLTKAFQRLNEGYNFIGRSLEQRNYVMIENELLRCPKTTIIFNADFSGHDNHVDEYQIVCAFAVLRLCFPERWKFMDKMFYYFISTMLCKHIVIPGSQFIYRIYKGIATGNPFTSLINTTVAYMTFATAINKVSNYSELLETRLFVAGDDVIGVIPISILEKLSDEITLRSGMKIDPLTDHCGPLYSNDISIQRSFLKKKFTLMGPAWNNLELIDNLCTSTSGYQRSTQEIQRITMMMMNGPCDFLLNDLVRKIIRKHFVKPRIRGPSYYNAINGFASSPKYKYAKNYFNRSPKRIFDKEYRKYLMRTFNNRLRLAFRWFNMGQPFPALGYKDDSYWIDATKELFPPTYYPFRSKLKLKLRKYFKVKWQD